MTAKGKTNGMNRIAREMIMPLSMKQRRLRREEDERWKNKIMMTVIASTIRNRKRKSAKLINNPNKGHPPEEYTHHAIVRCLTCREGLHVTRGIEMCRWPSTLVGRMCRVGKHATRVIERCRWPSTMVVTNSARPEEAWDGILPYNIMASDILPRLPVKTLARFRRVCKKWRSLTYDTCFVMEQLIRGANADHASTRLHMFNCDCIFAPIKQKTRMYNLDGLNGNGINGDREIIEDVSFDFKFRCSGWYILSNSINGLICALCGDDSEWVAYPYLFNPTIREVLPLPEVSGCLETMSLGFDSSSGKYKAVCSISSSRTSTTFRVLTVGSRDWRCLAEINCLVRSIRAVSLNGALHWRVSDRDTGSTTILVFDIKDERFRFIPIPDSIASEGIGKSYDLALRKLKGHLCLVRHPVASRSSHEADGRPFLRKWKLEEGSSPEWRRVYDIDMTGCADDAADGRVARVIDEVGGKILINWGPRLYSYDEGCRTFNLITECLSADLPCDTFTPSLVSPGSLLALAGGEMPRFNS